MSTSTKLRRGRDSEARPSVPRRGHGTFGTRWRIAARLARRQVRRTLSSSVLIAILVALPIAGMTAFSVVVWSTTSTPEEAVRAELGQMEAWVQPVGVPGAGFWQSPSEPTWYGYPFTDDQMVMPDGEPLSDPTTTLAAGTETIAVTEGQVVVSTAGGTAPLPAWSGEVWDPRFEGRFTLGEGRVPNAPDEALVSHAALERIGISIGDEITLPDSDVTLTVVGAMSAVGVPSDQAVLFLPEGTPVVGTTQWFLPDRELSWVDVQKLNEQGVVAYSRAVVLDPPVATSADHWSTSEDGFMGAPWGLLVMLGVAGLFSAYVVVMLAGAAFSVAARRQQRSLAVAASVGATPADLRRTIVLQGTVLGLAGGLVGLALGLGVAALIMNLTDDGSGTRYWGMHVPWPLLGCILIFAILVGTVSATIPARTVARSDILSALRGARRPQTPRASRPVWGSIILLVGVGITIASATVMASVNLISFEDLSWDSPARVIPPIGIVIGPIMVQLGILLSGRWLLWLTSRALSRLGIAARLASRDAAANASRTVPAFAAIGAAVFITVFALSQVSMQNANNARNWFYQSAVDTLSVSFYPSGQGEVEPLTAQQSDTAVESALTLATGAGARATAVVRAQPYLGDYPTPQSVPDDLVWAMALMPEKHLVDPMSQAGYSSNGRSPNNPISVIEPDGLALALGVDVSAADLDAYREGSALVADARWATNGTIDVAGWTARDTYQGKVPNNIWAHDPDQPAWAAPLWEDTLEAIVVELPHQPITIAISPETADRLGIVTEPTTVLADFPEPPSDQQLDRIQSQAGLLSPSDVTLAPHYERGPSNDAFWMIPILAGVAVLVLGASAVALGLARFERRPDDATLTAVGGTPALRRRISFWQGLIIAGFGTMAGAAAGILPPIGFSIQSQETLLITDMPWLALGALAVILPLLIAVVSWLVPPRSPDLTRRTVIA